MRKQKGFSIVELLVAIALIAIVTAIAVPGFLSWLPRYRLRSAAQDVLSNFQKAKLTAVKRNANTAVCFSTSGYTVFVDLNNNYLNDDGSSNTIISVAWSDYKSLNVNPAFNTFDNTFPGSTGERCMAFRPNSIPVDGSAGGFSGVPSREVLIGNTSGETTKVMVSPAGGISIE